MSHKSQESGSFVEVLKHITMHGRLPSVCTGQGIFSVLACGPSEEPRTTDCFSALVHSRKVKSHPSKGTALKEWGEPLNGKLMCCLHFALGCEVPVKSALVGSAARDF